LANALVYIDQAQFSPAEIQRVEEVPKRDDFVGSLNVNRTIRPVATIQHLQFPVKPGFAQAIMYDCAAKMQDLLLHAHPPNTCFPQDRHIDVEIPEAGALVRAATPHFRGKSVKTYRPQEVRG
jgi:hypothetical protein